MVDTRARHRASWWRTVLAAAVMLWGHAAQAEDFAAQQQRAFRSIASQVSMDNLRRHVETLASFDSRVTGYPGCKQAEEYVYRYFQHLGLQDVHKEPFLTDAPVNRGSSLELYTDAGVETLPLYPLWPNNVRTSQLPPAGVSGQLVWGGRGELTELEGEPISGSIILFDFRCGDRWLNGPRLGAKVVIFVEPEQPSIRGESEAKFMSVPVNLPRFWLRRGDALRVMAHLQSQPVVKGRVKCDMGWVRADPDSERTGLLYRGHNIVATIPGTDPKLRHQVVILNAYYDSMSIVPEIAPGAESACGIATLLELARIFTHHPPRRTVKLLATAGHFEAMTGIRAYFGSHLQELERGKLRTRRAKFLGLIPYSRKYRVREKINLFFALDLSSQTSRVGIFYKGYFYNYSEDRQTDFSDIGRFYSDTGAVIAAELGYAPDDAFVDGINPVVGKPWRSFIPGKIALENEAFTLGVGMGVGLVTTDDGRACVDTPWDLPQYVDFRNLHRQARFIACSLWAFVNHPQAPVDKDPSFHKMTRQFGGFALLHGRVVTFNPREGLIPKDPLPGSLVTVRSSDPTIVGELLVGGETTGVGRIAKQTFMGVRGDMAQLVDDKGAFTFYGVPTANAFANRRPIFVDAYHADPRTGDIDHAPDLGEHGHRAFSISLLMTSGEREATVVVFPCVSIALFEIVDPLSLRTIPELYVYDGATDAEPRSFGYAISRPGYWVSRMNDVVSRVEDVALVFAARPAEWEVRVSDVEVPPTRVKVMMQSGATKKRLVLLEASAKHPTGRGELADHGRLLSRTPLRVASDMWYLDESRIQRLRRFRIIDQALEDMHARAKQYLDRARAARKARDYLNLEAHARAAWGYEVAAYPRVQTTEQDVVRGVLFYLLLIIPFAFFLERLLVAFHDLRGQIAVTVIIFALTFLLFRFIHPAFGILQVTPVVMLLAFIMIMLSALVIFMVFSKFEAQLRALHTKMGGIHRADIGRLSVAMSAFTLGISNMRRRRARTLLTCVTLVLLTFTVLSFTSVVTSVRYYGRPFPGKPRYNGIMLRSDKWDPLEEPAYRIFNDELGTRYPVAARAWFSTSLRDEQTFMRLTTTTSEKECNVRVAVGLTPAEAEVTRPQETLIAGRWFRPQDTLAAIVPTGVARALNLTRKDVGKAKLNFSGLALDLIGIASTAKLRQLKDLDDEMLTPVDLVEALRLQRAGRQPLKGEVADYIHLSPDDCIFIPYSLAINLDGQLESVAVNLANPRQVERILRDLMPRLEFNLYAGMGNRVERWIARSAAAVIGLVGVLVPVLIAALIVLNTMLGSVYERVREIGVFSSVGLAPGHIATLFLAEAFVYAIIGAILGYVIGQGTVKLFTHYDLLPGLYLNYSSLSAVLSTAIIIGVVLLSTIYPARKASEVATPAVDRRWHVPDPVGDEWDIPMPFAVTGAQAVALNAFMSEWFSAYEEYSIGDFVTENVTTEEHPTEHGTAYVISFMTWLAPFDLGVSQRTELHTVPTEMEDVFEIKLKLRRQSGDVSSWQRVNRRFLHTLRKQFLIWRTLSAQDRERYLKGSEAASAT